MQESRLNILVNQSIVGNLNYENGEYIFVYNTQTNQNFISLSMPIRSKNYINKNSLPPIFEMHLPEGYLLSIFKKHFSKIIKMDDFGLLKLISPLIYGRITYQNNLNQISNKLTLDELLHSKKSNLFDELVLKFALHSPLSGVQPKVLAKIEDKITLKLEEYIVKSWGEEYPHLSLNEYYSMQIVKYSGVKVPKFYLSDDDKLFIIKRFDIEDNIVFGFEDMCVLQAKSRDDKYEGSYESVAKTIKTFVSPKYKKSSLIDFYKMIIINNLIQNGDAHLKNFGLLYSDINNIYLAPAYDIVSTTLYIKNDISALNLLGSKKWWGKKFLIRFGVESCQLSLDEANIYFDKVISSIKKVSKDVEMRYNNELDMDKKEFLNRLLEIYGGALRQL